MISCYSGGITKSWPRAVSWVIKLLTYMVFLVLALCESLSSA